MAKNDTFFIHKILLVLLRKGLNHIWLERSHQDGCVGLNCFGLVRSIKKEVTGQ